MMRWTLPATAAVLLAAAWWHWPAAAQRAPEPAASTSEMITFDQYRAFRARDLEQRQARLAHQLAAPGLSAAREGQHRATQGLLRSAGGDAGRGA